MQHHMTIFYFLNVSNRVKWRFGIKRELPHSWIEFDVQDLFVRENTTHKGLTVQTGMMLRPPAVQPISTSKTMTFKGPY